MTAPTITVTPVASPQPGFELTVTTTDPSAQTVRVWRTASDGTETVVRGADDAVIVGTLDVVDFEVALADLTTYHAVTYDLTGTPSDDSGNTTPQALTSATGWLADPLTPQSAVPVTISSWPDLDLDIDSALLAPIGASAPYLVAGQRQQGAGTVTLTAIDASTRASILGMIQAAPILLLRGLETWDIGVMFLGVTRARVHRKGLLSEPGREFALDVTLVQRPAPSIPAPLHTYDEMTDTGMTYAQLTTTAKTYLQWTQGGP